jgi:myo-inositol-1(or 4)-monophosphatase
VAAGGLIVQEAGGRVSDFSGTRYSIQDKEIIASNGVIHDQILGVIRAVQARS